MDMSQHTYLKKRYEKYFLICFICLSQTLDEVNITVETCDPNARQTDSKSPNGMAGGSAGGGGTAGGGSGGSLPQIPQGKYSFIHKVVDGITIIVNTVNVKFLSTAFTASVQVGRWQPAAAP